MCKLVLAVMLSMAAVLTVDRLLLQPHRMLHEAQAKSWREPHAEPNLADDPEAIDATLVVAEGEAEWPV